MSLLVDEALLHIGLHKTGTTSIQHFLHANRERLHALGISVYTGLHLAQNHVELHSAAIRVVRATPFKLSSGLVVDETYRTMVKDRVAGFTSKVYGRRPIFSAEGLSFLRYPDELDRLRRLVGERVRVIAYLRELESFRASYAAALRRQCHDAGGDRDSFAYLGDDSWLLDYEARLHPFRAAFGYDRVDVIDYDAAVRREGSVIPSFLRTLGVDHAFKPDEWEAYRLNGRDTLDATPTAAAAVPLESHDG